MERKLVVYSANWCKPCSALKERLTAKGLEFDVVDIEENDDLCVKHNVRSVPTTFVFEGDAIKLKLMGALNDKQIDQLKATLNGEEGQD